MADMVREYLHDPTSDSRASLGSRLSRQVPQILMDQSTASAGRLRLLNNRPWLKGALSSATTTTNLHFAPRAVLMANQGSRGLAAKTVE